MVFIMEFLLGLVPVETRGRKQDGREREVEL
jgi:hypothetical protein